ncbi:MAG: hypothetical protein ABIH18_03475 [Candidatus Omnitrophota bacterium]
MIEMEKHRLNIICQDNCVIKCTLNLVSGERVQQYLNDLARGFVVLNDVEMYYTEELRSFKLLSKSIVRMPQMVINKTVIKWIEEIK